MPLSNRKISIHGSHYGRSAVGSACQEGYTKTRQRKERRALLAAGGAWIAFAAVSLYAQSPKTLRRVALLHPGTEAGYRTNFEAFRAALRDAGYLEGRDISLETRWARGKTAQLESLAAEIVALNPAVIVTASSAGVAACRKATSSIPIVFATAASPVEQGFVADLRHPGGNVTGVVLYAALVPKMVEIAREAFPLAHRLAILVHDQDPIHKAQVRDFEPNARRLGFEPIVVHMTNADDLDRAFAEIAARKIEILYVPLIALLDSLSTQLAARALKARLPLLSSNPVMAESGGLLSYGTRTEENYRRAAALVDKILRGAHPSDLPVEQPERFVLIINRRTARAIGATLSPVTMLRANKVIE